jgi:hypothetical protein
LLTRMYTYEIIASLHESQIWHPILNDL